VEEGAISQWGERNQRGFGLHQPVRWESSRKWVVRADGSWASVDLRVPNANEVIRTKRGGRRKI